ncbi:MULTISPECIES: hypothetical protein [unclassified Desulfovibrio]|uniref:hypothetical protein n=1 Tax=unclassified Desulfovibrio TaxID=2593640 RepID=UPI000F5F1484|nr:MULTISPECIES: hypothetical protein [unclassified Desulfovibrio]RRD69617.1 hypothetical protein EII24_09365 [Desulfovibrio sp. OH1209_COT-279]RRD86270.1 hypothetical protein EII23_09365 [Desulfovibrio sp. OH1186_COT-070]
MKSKKYSFIPLMARRRKNFVRSAEVFLHVMPFWIFSGIKPETVDNTTIITAAKARGSCRQRPFSLKQRKITLNLSEDRLQ